MILAGVKLKATLYGNEKHVANRTISEILNVSEDTIKKTLAHYGKQSPTGRQRLKRHTSEWSEIIQEIIEMTETPQQSGMCAMATGKPYTYTNNGKKVYVRPDGISLPFVKGLYDIEDNAQ